MLVPGQSKVPPPLFSGCAEKAQFLRQARRQLVVLHDRAVLQRYSLIAGTW